MLAWLQRAWVLCLFVLAFVCAGWTLQAGLSWWLALGLAVLVLNIHALLLAIEFGLLSQVDPGPGVQRPDAWALLRAWWGEVWTGLRVFCWRQPFRSRAIPDSLPRNAIGRRGVVLVHGFVCNRGLWNPWMKRLAARGIPYVAVNLEPVFGTIDRYIPTIDKAVSRLEDLDGPKPIVVAHSMGGLAVRAWLRDRGSDQRVHSVITIATPHSGTWLARLAMTPNARQMRLGSTWLRALCASESSARRSLFTCFYGHCDNITFPASAATLRGADNRHISGVAHVHLAFQDTVFDEVLARAALADRKSPPAHATLAV